MISFASTANRHHAALHFLIAHHQHIGNLVLFRLADLETDLLVAEVRFNTVAVALEGGDDLSREFLLMVGDCQYNGLTGASHVGKAPA